MKKGLRGILLTILLALTVTISGCFAKTYSYGEMHIEMPMGYREFSYENFDYCITNNRAAMIVYNESFEEDFNSDTVTKVEYLKLVQLMEGTDYDIQESENGKYAYYTYTADVDGTEFYYMVTVHASDNAFWIIQFYCFENLSNKYHDKFISWANTVVFE